jgi:hypothetical protein
MLPGKPRIVAAAAVATLAVASLCGCMGGGGVDPGVNSASPNPGSGGGASTSNGGDPNAFPFPGGVGVSPDLGGTQGVATDPNNNVYISSNEQLSAYDPNFHQLWTNTNPFAGMSEPVTHFGDIEYANGYIYAPIEAWNGCSNFAPVLLGVYSASTGKLITWANITADGHEASAVAVVPATNQVIVSSYCPNENGYTTLWNYDLNALTSIPPGSAITFSSTTTLSASIATIQGISWDPPANLFLISADVDGVAGSLWVASPQGTVTGPVYIVPSNVGTELEGVDALSGVFYYLESGYVYGVGSMPAQPAFSVAAGTYCAPQSVTITDATAGAGIYYTTNGNAATTASTAYTGPITLSQSETINAIAAVSGSASSLESTAVYTIDASDCQSQNSSP